jgi:hypothetical protein
MRFFTVNYQQVREYQVLTLPINLVLDDSGRFRQGPPGSGGRAHPDPGSDGQVGKHQWPPRQRQRLFQQIPEYVSSNFY